MRTRVLLLFVACAVARADDLSAPSIVKTIRYHPTGTPARIGMTLLSREGERGWQALAALVAQYRRTEPLVALRAATALAEGPEPARLVIVAEAYNRIDDPDLRALFALALAYGFETHEALLLKHLRKNRKGAVEVLRILAPKTLPEQELRRLLATPDLAPISYEALKGRQLTVKAKELLPWARAVAPTCLNRDVCHVWARKGDFLFYEAIALALRGKDEDIRDGAHCLLLTLSGKKLMADADVWRSWMAAKAKNHEPAQLLSDGHIAAAVVRATRFLRADLLADGMAIWSADTGHHWKVGSTALAVLALRAAGYKASHPAIEKAVKTTLLQFGPRGKPALPAFPARGYETYQFSVLALALCELDPKRYRVPLAAIHKRLTTGMHANGMWGYRCIRPTDTEKAGRPDNSITQYAVLALRSLQRHGFKSDPKVWKAIGKNLQTTVNGSGGWNYHPGFGSRQVAMTSAGISSLAIAYEGLDRRNAAEKIQKSRILLRARSYLGRLLMQHDFRGEDLYAFYGVERAMVLTATKQFKSQLRSYDWYRQGAARLLQQQYPQGHWGFSTRHIKVGHSWGRVIDTSYAILFLTKATRTIGGSTGKGVIGVLIPKEKPQPPKPRVEPVPPPPPLPPLLLVESATTRDGTAVLYGRVDPEASLTMNGRAVPFDARGRIALPVTITRNETFDFVARGKTGETRRTAAVRFDLQLPSLHLSGPKSRHLGKQVVIFRADEPLRSLRVQGRTYPADGEMVRAAMDVREGERSHAVVFTDRAGNESRVTVETVATNRYLQVDGSSALGVSLREYPERFTLECWARGEAPHRSAALAANTEGSGYGLFWLSRGHPRPYAILHGGKAWVAVDPKKAWDWSDWTHLALTCDGVKLRYFVNGRLQGETDTDGHRRSRHRFFIGAQPNGRNSPVEFFKGDLDEVRLSSNVRYEKEFKPRRNFMRDRNTLLLMHFDRDVRLDDSGAHHHMDPHATPVLLPDPEDVIPFAVASLRNELPPLETVELTEQEHAEQNDRARESARSMHMVDVAVRTGVPGIEVRARHEAFDLAAEPVVTSGRGEAIVRLPRGTWLLDLTTHEPTAGSIVFARVRRGVRDAAPIYIKLDQQREIRFRGEWGVSRAAHVVTLAWPDRSLHKQVEVLQGQFKIRTAGADPMLLQAVRRPAERDPGYVIHRTIGPGKTIVTPDKKGTLHTFNGRGVRKMKVRYDNVDALPLPLAFESKDKRQVLFDGLRHVVLGLDLEVSGGHYGFYPRPVDLTGEPRTFGGLPPFKASVGYVLNSDGRYKEIRNGQSVRFFLLSANDLMMRYDPKGAYSITWKQVLDNNVLAQGTIFPPAAARTPPIDPKRLGDIRYRLHIRGPKENRKLEVAGHAQTALAKGGEIQTPCFPEVLPNAVLWCEAVSRGARAYEETCPNRRAFTHIDRSIHMPGRLAGMGGGGGNRGWMWLPEGSVYGFVGQWYWTGLLSHELGHVYGYGHSNPKQTRIMQQAGRRAGRRLWAIRPGMARAPEGNRYLRLLEAVTRGETSVVQNFDDARDIPVLRKTGEGHDAGDGILTPNLEITGNDDVFLWYFRSMFGPKVDEARRANTAAWSWHLTLQGFNDPEIQIALYSHAAKTSLAWLARMRGNMVYDYRIDAATKLLRTGKFVDGRARGGIIHRWRNMDYRGADLAAREAEMRAELGHRWWRFFALKEMARELFARREVEAGEKMLIQALVEARLGGEALLAGALAESALIWAAR
ncbi:MAG: LamG-like jellyroll fold domain-containing protein [Planctomycetota bacterium]